MDCWHGDVDKSKPKVDSSRCKAESWNPTYRGHTFKYNGANKNNAVYQLSAPARYMGCWSDTDGRAFSDVITGLTMQACADATRELGSAWWVVCRALPCLARQARGPYVTAGCDCPPGSDSCV